MTWIVTVYPKLIGSSSPETSAYVCQGCHNTLCLVDGSVPPAPHDLRTFATAMSLGQANLIPCFPSVAAR